MANVYPSLSDTELNRLPSQAEAKLYRALKDQLPNTDIVLHSRTYVAKSNSGNTRDGEADFVIFSREFGLLIVEAKGGGVSFDPSTGWFSIDRSQKQHKIKNPFLQAKQQKYSIISHLKSHKEWNLLNKGATYGHAVIFTDLSDCTGLLGIDTPQEIIGTFENLRDVQSWIKNVQFFWSKGQIIGLQKAEMDVIYNIFCKPIFARPLVKQLLSADDEIRIQLTDQQAKVLRTLSRHKRAGISGPAGTGKTILAIEKAKMLAEAGKKVLLLCYNKPLGASIYKQFTKDSKVHVFTFHQYCEHIINSAKKTFRIDYFDYAQKEIPGADPFEDIYPLAASYAIEAFGDQAMYDAVIVDEGQDFSAEFWLTIEISIRNGDESWLYVFFDENQKLYTRNSAFPIKESQTFPLTMNCRNAKPIHNLAYEYYSGDAVDDSKIHGSDPILIVDPSSRIQAKNIIRHILHLISNEQLTYDDIAILIANNPKKDYYQLLFDQIKNKYSLNLSFEEHQKSGYIIVDTVKRFKGLERNVVFLWLDDMNMITEQELYVGISRAKSLLYLVGNMSLKTRFNEML